MLVEESMEQLTRKILIHLGYQPVKGRNPLSVNDRGRNAENQDFVDRCIAGALIRWKRGADNNLHKTQHATCIELSSTGQHNATLISPGMFCKVKTTRICAAITGITAIKYSERDIT